MSRVRIVRKATSSADPAVRRTNHILDTLQKFSFGFD